uniref:L-type lectin-domain containing receptor kinase IX.1-like n=1 Tax=Erigeron canadensis TaxID=72917 RepID=UPI001CB94AF4|nr:L-type lectin-domain containing receptor kinase IX.1-like [Erigeron canadensis]
MAFFSMTHKIISFLFVLIPYATSLTFNLINITARNQNLDIIIQGEGANISIGEIQLTPDLINSDLPRNNSGRAIYVRPLHLWDSRSDELASFSSNFTFVIDSNQNASYGDGLTFFLAQNNSLIRQGGSMGLPINEEPNMAASPFVAVEFDTFWNFDWDPYIGRNITMGDHVGIDVSSLSSAKSEKWLSNVTGGGVCQAWITYDSVSKNLSVSFTGYQNNTIVRQDGLFHTVDLRRELPEWVIFGFSAATGSMFQRNAITSWTFSSSELKVDVNNQMPPPPSPEFLNPKPGSENGKSSKGGLIVGVSVAIAFVVVLAFLLWKMKKNKRGNNETEEISFDTVMNNEFEMGIGPKEFSYDELAQSTSNFAENKKLGEGGLGGVYKGFLADSNTYIAVKRLSKSSKQGIKEYASEVNIISQLRHRNLVQLTGWCHEKGELLLVYEYMENGSLDSHLFGAKSLLKWDTRYKIANCLASAVLYLHEEWEKCVLHRDIKSSNVMLDSNFNAKLGDFGLAKLVDHEKGLQTTMLAGTLGYMAPEYVVTGKATKESDVFSFGVVALEIACGRKAIEYKAQEKQIQLLEWVWELYGTGTLLEAVDPHLGLDFVEEEIQRLMIIGLWCVHSDAKLRPSMRQVIQVLNSETSLPMLPSTMPGASYLASRILSLFGIASVIHYQSSSSVFNTNN